MQTFIRPLSIVCAGLLLSATLNAQPLPKPHAHYIILYIWDGLRADAITPETAPNLYQLMQTGVQFLDNHSSYPTFTMMNAASFATGDRAGKTGFYGNTLWQPKGHGTNAQGETVDFNQPVFTEDYKILQDLNQDHLFWTGTLFEAAHQHHLTTVAVGKSGPAFMQDYLSQGVVLDERHVSPLSIAQQFINGGFPLPKYASFGFPLGELILSATNGDPTAAKPINYLPDGVSTDPEIASVSPFNASNEYMENLYLTQLLPQKAVLSVIWMRNPDTTEHVYGPGTPAYYSALRQNDQFLARLIAQLKKLKMLDETDIIVVSDHAHSTVSGPLALFPLRPAKAHGPHVLAASGAVRTADLLTHAGFHAYDGMGCRYNPEMSGIKANGELLYPTQIDLDGKRCGTKGMKYITPAYWVPKQLPTDAIIIAANGGSDYFYLPSHDLSLAKKVIRFLQSHLEFDIIFVDASRYPAIPGTIPLNTVDLQNPQGRNPDIICGFSYDVKTAVHGFLGIEYSDSSNERGMHGSFSPVDVHNFLAAMGPDFKKHFKDALPTGNVDVAPTIAYLLAVPFNSEGRVLYEALAEKNKLDYSLAPIVFKAANPAVGLTFYNAFNEKTVGQQYTSAVKGKVLSEGARKFLYFDAGKAIRN